MASGSIVYGCIKNMLVSHNPEEAKQHRQTNHDVMMALPSIEGMPLLSREMFSMPVSEHNEDVTHTDVMHFGSSYKSVEYEWQQWIETFESMLKDMYWVSATVHLETEFNGLHTFTWEAEDCFHVPDQGNLSVRCEWSRETATF